MLAVARSNSHRAVMGLLLCCFASPCFGYVDPSGQGLVYQLAGPIMALFVVAMTFFRKILVAGALRLRRIVMPRRSRHERPE